MSYDLIIKNGQTIDGKPIEIAINAGKIAKVADKIEAESKQLIELDADTYLSAGWIDDHVHCFEKMTLYYDFQMKLVSKKA